MLKELGGKETRLSWANISWIAKEFQVVKSGKTQLLGQSGQDDFVWY